MRGEAAMRSALCHAPATLGVQACRCGASVSTPSS